MLTKDSQEGEDGEEDGEEFHVAAAECALTVQVKRLSFPQNESQRARFL